MAAPLVGALSSAGVPAYMFSRWTALLLGFGFGVYAQGSPYAPNPDMTHSYSHPGGGMYAQPRPDWAGYGQHGGAPLTPGHPVYAQNAASAQPPQRPNQVC